jgi:hypothetical protein
MEVVESYFKRNNIKYEKTSNCEYSYLIKDFTYFNESNKELFKDNNNILTGKDDDFNKLFDNIKSKNYKIDLAIYANDYWLYFNFYFHIMDHRFLITCQKFKELNFNFWHDVMTFIKYNMINIVKTHYSFNIGNFILHINNNKIWYRNYDGLKYIYTIEAFIEFVNKYVPEYLANNDIKIALKY